jgi:hypothetical protein
MPDIAPAWYVSLAGSVQALGAAARDLRAAHDHAQHAAWTADPARLVAAPGLITVPGTGTPSTAGAEPVRPHEEALRQLGDLYAVLRQHTYELYENAALGHAYGAAQALTAVLRGDRPVTVVLARDAHGRYVRPAGGLPDLAQSLTVQAGGPELDRLRGDLLAHLDAYEALATDAFDTDAPGDEDSGDDPGLADAAHAYGEQAERSLAHLIRFADAHGFLQAG